MKLIIFFSDSTISLRFILGQVGKIALFAKSFWKLYNFGQMSERPSFPQIIEKEKAKDGFNREFDVIVGGEGLNFRFQFFLLEKGDVVSMKGNYVWWGSRGSTLDDKQVAIMAASSGVSALQQAINHVRDLYPESDLVIEPKVLKIAGQYTAWNLPEDLQKLELESPQTIRDSA